MSTHKAPGGPRRRGEECGEEGAGGRAGGREEERRPGPSSGERGKGWGRARRRADKRRRGRGTCDGRRGRVQGPALSIVEEGREDEAEEDGWEVYRSQERGRAGR